MSTIKHSVPSFKNSLDNDSFIVPKGFIISSGSSGKGKTIITSAIARLFYLTNQQYKNDQQDNNDSNNNIPKTFNVGVYKCGPDYIDPAYLAMAAQKPAYNLDPWAMRIETIAWLLCQHDYAVIEGVTGLFDGGENSAGSTASLARLTGFPVILIMDAKARAQSLAAEILGYCNFDPNIKIAGVILNQVASTTHLQRIDEGLKQLPMHMPIIAALPFHPQMQLRSRHLGLYQADELELQHFFLDQLCQWACHGIDGKLGLSAFNLFNYFSPPNNSFSTHLNKQLNKQLQKAKSKSNNSKAAARLTFKQSLPFLSSAFTNNTNDIAPIRIAIAKDCAFSFCYAHWLLKLDQAFEDGLCDVSFFSPLDNEIPKPDAQYIFLPGGYPELFAKKLSQANNFIKAMQRACENDCVIYGECGGFMVLGRAIIDGDGIQHSMCNLLPITTSLALPKRTLGLRNIKLTDPATLNTTIWRGHEFHYAQIVEEHDKLQYQPMALAANSTGKAFDKVGMQRSCYSKHNKAAYIVASFIHCVEQYQ